MTGIIIKEHTGPPAGSDWKQQATAEQQQDSAPGATNKRKTAGTHGRRKKNGRKRGKYQYQAPNGQADRHCYSVWENSLPIWREDEQSQVLGLEETGRKGTEERMNFSEIVSHRDNMLVILKEGYFVRCFEKEEYFIKLSVLF